MKRIILLTTVGAVVVAALVASALSVGAQNRAISRAAARDWADSCLRSMVRRVGLIRGVVVFPVVQVVLRSFLL